MIYTPAMRDLSAAFDCAVEELDGFLGRVARRDPVLRLERESATWWIVVDARNDRVMLRAEHGTCVRFGRAFVVKHPEARLDESFASSGEGEPSDAPPASASGASPDLTAEQLFALGANRLIDVLREEHSVRVPLAPVIPLHRKETA